MLSMQEKLLYLIKYRFSISICNGRQKDLYYLKPEEDVKRILGFLKGEIQSANVDRFSAAI